MKPGQLIWIRNAWRFSRATFIREYTTPPCIKVRRGNKTFLVQSSRVLDEFRYRTEREANLREEKRLALDPVIKAWEQGLREVHKISQQTGIYHLAVYQKLRAAKAWKFIK